MSAADRLVSKLARRLSELERRLENTVRHGTVKEVDTKKHSFRMVIGKDGEGAEQLSPWIKYGQHAGDFKHHSPPTVGQTMTAFSPGGDFTQAVAIPLTWSNKNKSPSDKPDEHVQTFGDMTITKRKKEMIFQHGKVTLHFRPNDTDALHMIVGDTFVRVAGDGVYIKGQKITQDGTVHTKNMLVDNFKATAEFNPPAPDYPT